MRIREMPPSELDSVGFLRVDAYEAQDLLASVGAYAPVLRSLGVAGGAPSWSRWRTANCSAP